MFSAMPKCATWMQRVTAIADQHGRVITAAGRILPASEGFGYKAVNHVCQGSAADVMYDTVVRMERDGLGDHLQLAIHDEVVVDTEVAGEVQRIMETPPEFLSTWAGRSPRLRTDRADLGHSWAKP